MPITTMGAPGSFKEKHDFYLSILIMLQVLSFDIRQQHEGKKASIPICHRSKEIRQGAEERQRETKKMSEDKGPKPL